MTRHPGESQRHPFPKSRLKPGAQNPLAGKNSQRVRAERKSGKHR
jgi:hypothetical protein